MKALRLPACASPDENRFHWRRSDRRPPCPAGYAALPGWLVSRTCPPTLLTQLSIEVADQVGVALRGTVTGFRRRNAVRPEGPENLLRVTTAGPGPGSG